jgi:copper chaperone
MSTTITYAVSGMTCGHCVTSVTEEISAIAGVQDVKIDLNPGSESRVTVTSDAPLADEAVREAVDEAGYELIGSPA